VEDNRSKYLRKMHTPTPFSQGPEMKNYSRMMELQAQAPNFAKNDPRFDELKDRRRTYNRFDKYKIGEKFNVAPLDVQKDFSNRSNVFRNAAPNVYGKMYPVSDIAMKYGESGGLLGLMAKEMLGKVSDFGKSLTNKEGIAGAADTNEEEMQDYAEKTFGFDGTTRPYPQQDFFVDAETFGERDVEIPRMDDDVGDFYEYDQDDNIVLSPERPMPFDDSNREQGIRDQYATNFIGPRDDPSRRPDMYDVAGPRLIDRGLIPYPSSLNEEVTEVPPPFYGGRGEMPQPYEYDSSEFYRNMAERYGEAAEYNLREKELQDALAADQGRSFLKIPSDFDPSRKVFTDTEDYYDWIRQMEKYGYR